MNIIRIPSENVAGMWPYVSHHIEAALMRGLDSIEGVYRDIKLQNAQLYVVLDGTVPIAAFVIEIVDYDKDRTCNVVALGGKGLERWLPQVEDTIYQHAKNCNCKYVEMTGRRGWLRELQKFGWHEHSVEMIKEVSYG